MKEKTTFLQFSLFLLYVCVCFQLFVAHPDLHNTSEESRINKWIHRPCVFRPLAVTRIFTQPSPNLNESFVSDRNTTDGALGSKHVVYLYISFAPGEPKIVFTPVCPPMPSMGPSRFCGACHRFSAKKKFALVSIFQGLRHFLHVMLKNNWHIRLNFCFLESSTHSLPKTAVYYDLLSFVLLAC